MSKITIILKRIILFILPRRFISALFAVRELCLWFFGKQFHKRINPPHIIKRKVIKGFQVEYGIKIFVETGTYYGDMVAAVRHQFDRIISIELDDKFVEYCRRRFRHNKHIEIIKGDSSYELKGLMHSISEKCLFWLDGHYSGGITACGSFEYPVLNELKIIQSHNIRDHVIIIDDARLFTGGKEVPSQEEILNSLHEINPMYTIRIQYDMIQAFVPLPIDNKKLLH